ncbi:MAG: Maf family protein [Chloroflexi bacterium]|nr:Maf family protein [Chloroflexota bacterium]
MTKRGAAGSIVLASESPRRRDLLAALGVSFSTHPPQIDESSGEPCPGRRAVELALAKARAVDGLVPGALVLGADTIVVAPDAAPLGKPPDAESARAMLHALRGRVHRVVTGVAAIRGERSGTECVSTRVRMRSYSRAEIERYLARGEPFDKAGGYAIQDREFAPAAETEGCLCSVIGLPLWSARRLLAAIGGIASEPPALESCFSCPLRDGPAAAAGVR